MSAKNKNEKYKRKYRNQQQRRWTSSSFKNHFKQHMLSFPVLKTQGVFTRILAIFSTGSSHPVEIISGILNVLASSRHFIFESTIGSSRAQSEIKLQQTDKTSKVFPIQKSFSSKQTALFARILIG